MTMRRKRGLRLRGLEVDIEIASVVDWVTTNIGRLGENGFRQKLTLSTERTSET